MSTAERDRIMPRSALLCSIEAGVTLGWERFTGRDGLNFGIDTFGASAPIDALYAKFGLTAPTIAAKILSRIKETA